MEDNTIYIALCDDDLGDLKEARKYLDEFLNQDDQKRYDFTVHEYKCGKALISSGVDYHIMLQDVEMPEMNGFDVVREMEKRAIKPKVIFLTHHVERADESFFVDTHRYLYKPINRDKFQEALSSAIRIISEIEWLMCNYVDVDGTREKVILKTSDVIYIESLGRGGAGSVVYMRDKHYETRKTLKEWLRLLPASQFLQSSKIYIVNIEYVLPIIKKAPYTNNLELKTGICIDASRAFIDAINKGIITLVRNKRRR